MGPAQVFESVVLAAIVFNAAFLACEHYGQSAEWSSVLQTANMAFVIFFAVEAALKIAGLTWSFYWAGA
jgi:hypothetical protein